MIEKDLFHEISVRYGHCSSWAVWAEEGNKPKSNVGELSVFDFENNPKMLDIANPEIIMVGLNISRPVEFTFGNFHDKRYQSQDYKIRYAFKGTKFWGAYMTDIIKDFEQLISGNVGSYLRANNSFELQNIDSFKRELVHIKTKNPLIIAFGNLSFDILNRHFRNDFQILKVPHYSMQISRENYKKEIEKQLL